MPLLNYKKRFAASVKNGRKNSTIRKTRKIPIKVGDTLYHYTGLRTKSCEKLLESICTETYPVRITVEIKDIGDGIKTFRSTTCNPIIFINNIELSFEEIKELARKDGCGMGWNEFISLFEKMHGFPFEGQIIYWK